MACGPGGAAQGEKELTRRSDELVRKRQELPWVRVDKDYRFETDEGKASLADLFRGRSQLLIYHFMCAVGFTSRPPARPSSWRGLGRSGTAERCRPTAVRDP